MNECTLCPRMCHARRTPEGGNGFCGLGSTMRLARIAPHYWEEPPISGTKGTGALFFSGTPTAKKYTSEDSKAYIVLKEDSTFEFNYSLLSSTIPTGKYKIIGRQVHCYDNSEYELKYVFDVKGDTLSFNALLSSKLPAFSEVKNGSLFK